MPFFGRREELGRLRNLLKKKSASLVVIKGRRRIGKSRLTEEFGKDLNALFLIGLPPTDETTAQDQREDFARQMARKLNIPLPVADDWGDLFWVLAQNTSKGRILLVLDEISWMGSKDPTFLGKLKNAWDEAFKRNPELILILSGSLSAWIERNILSSTGFMGRSSLELTLKELPLQVCNEFWGSHLAQISDYEKFKVLSVTGGVPRYLEEINPSISAEENLARLAYTPGGILFEEFDRIFSDLFQHKASIYKHIVERLVDGVTDLNGICKALRVEKSGSVSEYLDVLVETGYVARDRTWNLKSGKESNLHHYRLSDNYLRYYLKYIQPHKTQIERGTMRRPPLWQGIMGLQFENLVLSNRLSLHALLGIRSEEIIYDNPFFQRATQAHKGCQIDYLIQTRFGTLYLCEIKFSKEKIGSKVIEEVREKVQRLSRPRHCSIRPVLIHVNGVTDDVLEAGYFSDVVDFGTLLR